MNASKLLNVSGIRDVKKDKNKNNYKGIELSTAPNKLVIDLFTGKQELVKDKVKTRVINVFEHNYQDVTSKAKELGCEIKDLKKDDIKDIKPDFGWDLEEGDKIQGDIVTRNVDNYPIVDESTGEERIVNYYTCAVLGDTEDPGFEQTIKQTFKANDRTLIENKLSMQPIATAEVKEAKETFAEIEK